MSDNLLEVIITFVVGIIGAVVVSRKWFGTGVAKYIGKKSSAQITTTQIELDTIRFQWIIGTVLVVFPLTLLAFTLLMNSEIKALKDRIQAYEQSEQWQLPDTLQALKGVADDIKITTDERKQIDSDRTAFEAQISQLQSDLEQKNAQITEINSNLQQTQSDLSEEKRNYGTLQRQNETLQAQIDEYKKLFTAEVIEFEVGEGESFPVIKNVLFMGVSNIYDSYVTIKHGEESSLTSTRFPSVGETITISDYTLNITCDVTLISIKDSKAKFTVVCK